MKYLERLQKVCDQFQKDSQFIVRRTAGILRQPDPETGNEAVKIHVEAQKLAYPTLGKEALQRLRVETERKLNDIISERRHSG